MQGEQVEGPLPAEVKFDRPGLDPVGCGPVGIGVSVDGKLRAVLVAEVVEVVDGRGAERQVAVEGLVEVRAQFGRGRRRSRSVS